jgi:hypothetical protein
MGIILVVDDREIMSAGRPALEHAMKVGADEWFLKGDNLDMLKEKVRGLID